MPGKYYNLEYIARDKKRLRAASSFLGTKKQIANKNM